MKPLDPGIVFDALARRGSRTVVHLSRPLDLAPEGGTRWTVPRLAELVRDTATRLAAAGAGPGDHVAVVKRNHWDCVLVACAAARIGAVPALLSGDLAPQVLDTLLERLRPAVLVTQQPLLRAAAAADTDLTRHAARTVTLDDAVPDTAPPGPPSPDGARPVPSIPDRTPPIPSAQNGSPPIPSIPDRTPPAPNAQNGSPPVPASPDNTPDGARPGPATPGGVPHPVIPHPVIRQPATPLRALPTRPAAPVHRRPDTEPVAVHHTSGTTGLPKLAIHSTTTLIRRLAAFEAHRWPVVTARRGDTVASATSFVHGRALAWTVSTLWHQPRKVVIVADCDPETAGRTLGAHPPTVMEALPAAYTRWQRLAAEPDGPFRDVRMYISTFDAVHPPTVRAFLGATRHARPVWMQGWGQTETGPLTFRFLTRRALARSAQRHPTTRDLGRPVPGWVGLRIVDPVTFRPVPRGRLGLVLTRTRARCLGYVGEQDRWRDKTHGPWFNTGDLAVRTRSGALLLHDREIDMVPGLSCVELEDVLHDRLPEVEEAVVLGGVGRAPHAVLVVNSPLEPARWQAAVRDLPALAEPLTLAWDAVPRTATGKVRRHELRDRYLGGSATHGTGKWT